jgi:hypothetical protein
MFSETNNAMSIEAWAKALTAIDINGFSKLTREDVIEKMNQDENIAMLTNNFNKLSNYIVDDILQDINLSRAVQAMEKWIDIAYYMVFDADIKNYNAAMAILGALGNSDIHNLRQRAEKYGVNLLSDNASKKLEKFSEVIETNKNYKRMRDAIEKNQNSLPYLGMCLTDLTFAHDGNQKENRLDVMTKVIEPLMRCVDNAKKITLQENPVISSYIRMQITEPKILPSLSAEASEDEILRHAQAVEQSTLESTLYTQVLKKREINMNQMIPRTGITKEEILEKLRRNSGSESKNKLEKKKTGKVDRIVGNMKDTVIPGRRAYDKSLDRLSQESSAFPQRPAQAAPEINRQPPQRPTKSVNDIQMPHPSVNIFNVMDHVLVPHSPEQHVTDLQKSIETNLKKYEDLIARVYPKGSFIAADALSRHKNMTEKLAKLAQSKSKSVTERRVALEAIEDQLAKLMREALKQMKLNQKVDDDRDGRKLS